MGGVLPEVRRQIIADFYGKNVSKGRVCTFQHFGKMGCKKTAIYCVMKLVDAGESVEQKEGQGRPRKLTSAFVCFAQSNRISRSLQERALTLPFTNLHKIVH